MNFQNLEQRIISMYIDTFPDYVPVSNNSVSERAQKQFYDFMKNTYQSLYDNPNLLFSKTHDDDAHTYRFNKSADNKPELTNNMRRIAKKIEDFLTALFSIGTAGHLAGNNLIIDSDIKLNRNYLTILDKLGVTYSTEGNLKSFYYNEFDELFHAWKWLTMPETSLLSFSRCMFNPEYSYSRDIYKHLLGNEKAFQMLIDFLENNNYIRIDNRDNQISLDYVKNYDTKEMPVKDAWAERTHGGISVKYDPFVCDPAYFCLRVPKTKDVLAEFDKMSDKLKSFVVKYNKKCDQCRYCIQTDKTGKRKLSFITVEYDKAYNLCLLFPGFYYCWSYIDEELAACMIEYLGFIDKLLNS